MDFISAPKPQTITTLVGNVATGEFVYTNEAAAVTTLKRISTDANNVITPGTDGAAYYAGNGADASQLRAALRWAMAPKVGYISGRTYRASRGRSLNPTGAQTANTISLVPYTPHEAVTIDQITINIGGASGSGSARLVIYDSDANGYPNNLLFSSSSFLTTGTGQIDRAVAQTLAAYTQYWFGWHVENTPSFATTTSDTTDNMLGATNASIFVLANYLNRSVAFGLGAPNPFAFVATDLAFTANVPLVLFRKA